MGTFSAECNSPDFDCRSGLCISNEAECDGFNDCQNFADEIACGGYPKWDFKLINSYAVYTIIVLLPT